jgi:hypothetical protein
LDLVTTTLGTFLLLALAFVPGRAWASAVVGFSGFDLSNTRFDFFPAGTDLVLLGALVAYSGSGGVTNLVLGNWARDRGYGMGERAGFIPAAGGPKVHLAHTGFTFAPDASAMERWRGWWRVVAVDQWGVFFVGAILGMVLPALLYVTFLPRGTDIQGLAISAALANAVTARGGAAVGLVIAFLGAWILFKTQLDNLEGWSARSPTSCGPAAVMCAPGAAATCAPSTTRSSRRSSCGASSRSDLPADRALEDRRQRRRGRVRRSRRRICSMSTRVSCPNTCVRRCGGVLRSSR